GGAKSFKSSTGKGGGDIPLTGELAREFQQREAPSGEQAGHVPERHRVLSVRRATSNSRLSKDAKCFDGSGSTSKPAESRASTSGGNETEKEDENLGAIGVTHCPT
ncbi:hypothetical protein FRX31_026189, partial [Thalictrum thalictroides]